MCGCVCVIWSTRGLLTLAGWMNVKISTNLLLSSHPLSTHNLDDYLSPAISFFILYTHPSITTLTSLFPFIPPLMIDAVLIMHGAPEKASKWWCALWCRGRGGGQQRRWQPPAGMAPQCAPGTRAAARRRGGAAAAARAGRAPPAGRGRYIGKSQSQRPRPLRLTIS
eukprot:COSAG01_NODE_2533_length_7491_cov_236.560741_12_plen_167_part_00